jgi:hypothetical protein
VFVALGAHGLFWVRQFRPSLLAALAVVAGLCLLTRVTTAFGLYLALGLLMASLALSSNRGGAQGLRGLLFRIFQPRLLLPAAILAAFLIIAGAINAARWGNPLEFADMHAQTSMMAYYPGRLERLDRYGLFNIQRLGYGFLYYFFPIWNGFFDRFLPLGPRIETLFDALEAPPTSIFLTDPLTVCLAICGLALSCRRRIPVVTAQAVLMMMGLAVPGALMLVAWYMAYRYRVEFAPLIVLGSCLGAVATADWLTRASPRARRFILAAVVSLGVLQVVIAVPSGIVAMFSHYGPTTGYTGVSMPQYYGHVIAVLTGHTDR